MNNQCFEACSQTKAEKSKDFVEKNTIEMKWLLAGLRMEIRDCKRKFRKKKWINDLLEGTCMASGVVCQTSTAPLHPHFKGWLPHSSLTSWILFTQYLKRMTQSSSAPSVLKLDNSLLCISHWQYMKRRCEGCSNTVTPKKLLGLMKSILNF